MKAPHHECIALKTLQSQKHKVKPAETRKAMSVSCVCASVWCIRKYHSVKMVNGLFSQNFFFTPAIPRSQQKQSRKARVSISRLAPFTGRGRYGFYLLGVLLHCLHGASDHRPALFMGAFRRKNRDR